jgi:hypothetical protein
MFNCTIVRLIKDGRNTTIRAAVPINCAEHHSPTEIKDTSPADLHWRETGLVPSQEKGPPLQEVAAKLQCKHMSTTSGQHNNVLGLLDLLKANSHSTASVQELFRTAQDPLRVTQATF